LAGHLAEVLHDLDLRAERLLVEGDGLGGVASEEEIGSGVLDGHGASPFHGAPALRTVPLLRLPMRPSVRTGCNRRPRGAKNPLRRALRENAGPPSPPHRSKNRSAATRSST